MNAYRLDRRFVFQAIGLTLLLSGAAFVVGMLLGPNLGGAIASLVGIGLLVRAFVLWFRPPVVVRTDAEGVTLGGRLTVKPVSLTWKGVENVSHETDRLLIDRGDETVIVLPLAFVGRRRDELVVEVYERLNTAHGYQRFDPTA